MRQKLKKLGCYIIIIVLLPYVVTVFLNGPSITTYSHVDSTYIKVKSGKKEVKNTASASWPKKFPHLMIRKR